MDENCENKFVNSQSQIMCKYGLMLELINLQNLLYWNHEIRIPRKIWRDLLPGGVSVITVNPTDSSLQPYWFCIIHCTHISPSDGNTTVTSDGISVMVSVFSTKPLNCQATVTCPLNVDSVEQERVIWVMGGPDRSVPDIIATGGAIR